MLRVVLATLIIVASVIQVIKSLRLKSSLTCVTHTEADFQQRIKYINISIFFAVFSILILVIGIVSNMYIMYGR